MTPYKPINGEDQAHGGEETNEHRLKARLIGHFADAFGECDDLDGKGGIERRNLRANPGFDWAGWEGRFQNYGRGFDPNPVALWRRKR
jgi:hypothetical protein